MYLDSPPLLTADQFEVLAHIGAVAKETHFDDLHWEDAFLADSCHGRHSGGIQRVGGRHAFPGQGHVVIRHHARPNTRTTRTLLHGDVSDRHHLIWLLSPAHRKPEGLHQR